MYLPDSEQVPCKQVFLAKKKGKRKKIVKMKSKNEKKKKAHVFKANIIH